MPHNNILLLIADDLGKCVGAYGSTAADTPVIDAFAAQGVRFDYAFASTASCSGSRSTLYTGLHTHENGQYGLNIFRTHFQSESCRGDILVTRRLTSAFPHVDTAPKLFNEAGYLTGILGKVHVGPDETYPWTWRRESESRDVAYIADQAEEFFQTAKQSDQPFFLTLGYVDPHRDITTRGGFGNDETYDPRVTKRSYDPSEVEVPSWLSDLPEVRRELAEYYEAVNRTDQGIGMVLEALERQGLAEDTLVIITSDNGPPFINAKTTLYDAGTCLPFLAKYPKHSEAKGNTVNPNMISYIDVLPTLLDYAKIAPTAAATTYANPGATAKSTEAYSPPRIGRSFLPILYRSEVLPESQWQHHVFGSHTFHELQNYWPTRVIRTRRYKYHRNIAWRLDFPFACDLYASYTFEAIRAASTNPIIGRRPLRSYLFRPKEELFDLENDPDELVNLADDPSAENILAGLRRTLEEWQLKTHDLWFNRDGQSVRMLQRYAKDGLRVPDTLDMDLDTLVRDAKMVPVEAVLQ